MTSHQLQLLSEVKAAGFPNSRNRNEK